MKQFALAILFTGLAVSFAPAVARAETISDAERQKAVEYLEKTKKMYFETLKGLTDAQWNFKAAPEKWSVFEVAEHIANVEDQIWLGMQQVVRTPVDDAKVAALAPKRKQTDGLLLMAVPERSRKVSSPEEVKPTGRYKDPNELLAHFEEARSQTLQYAKTTKDDLRVHYIKHFVFGDLDLYQWLLMLAAHNDRHMKQIAEVMADPGYPKAASSAGQ